MLGVELMVDDPNEEGIGELIARAPNVMYTKGAIDVILSRTSNLSETDKQAVAEENFRLSNEGLRVLGFAKREFADLRTLTLDDETELEYLGLMAEMDPPREESAQAVNDCINAGIKPIMSRSLRSVPKTLLTARVSHTSFMI